MTRMQARGLLLIGAVVASTLGVPQRARADEGGVSFWLPGQFGSLAAAPAVPGWSFASVYYHTSVSGGGDVAAARQITIGKFNPTVTVNLNASLAARPNLAFVNANYVFQNPVLGGQLALGVTTAFGHSNTSIDGTLTGVVGGIPFTRQGSITDERWGYGDLYPMASLRWNQGVNNYMVYLTGDIPVGTYNSDRLANFGIGHAAIDGGVGYTYFNPQTGHEFSVVTGMTYNFENPDTNYRNGINWHLDWGASQFLSKQLHVGLVGYFYNQLTDDSGASPQLGGFRSRVAAIGPQIGYIFPVGTMQGYLNLKGYHEFDAAHRAEGWSTWLTFSISPAAPTPVPSSGRMITKAAALK